jgi:hypothetical protein
MSMARRLSSQHWASTDATLFHLGALLVSLGRRTVRSRCGRPTFLALFMVGFLYVGMLSLYQTR